MQTRVQTMDRRSFLIGCGTVAAGGLLTACAGPSVTAVTTSAPTPLPHVKLGSVTISAANAAIWSAEDGGYLKKYGVDAEVINISDSTLAVPAILAGEVPLNCGVSGSAVVASALQGSDVVFVAVTVNTFPSSLYARPAISSVAGLRGMKIGVTRFGTASDTSGRIVLKKQAGLEPKDVTLLQMGGNNETLAGLQSGQLDAGVLTPPLTLVARQAGFRELVDMGTLGIEYVYNGVATTRSFARQNGGLVESVLKAIIEGGHRFRTDQEFGKSVVASRTKLKDPASIDEIWRVFATKYLKEPPFPTDAGIKTVLDELGQSQPKALAAAPSSFYDDSFLKKLGDSGFIKSITGS